MAHNHAESFFDFFERPEQHYSTAPYSNRLGASTDETTENEAKKYQSLFSDAFGHHVQFNLDTPPNISIQFNDSRRFVTADSLTSYFLDNLYQPPKILETPNTKPRPRDQVSFKHFMRSISDTPVTRPNAHGDAIGSNRLSYIVGDVGSGKTLLLCKLARELMREQRVKAADENQDLVVPVYFDFEKEMRGNGGRLLDVDDKFYGKLCDAILKYLEFFSIFRLRSSGVATVANREFPSAVTRLIAVVRHLHEQRLRLLLILDNIDGYHYYYDKYPFFPEYYRQQSHSIRRNIMGLSSALSEGENLGLLGLAVVLAARRYVYEDCMHTSAPEATSEYSGSVFQLEDVAEDQVVLSRLRLFEAGIAKIESEPKLRKFGEDYRKTLSRLNTLFGIRASGRDAEERDTSGFSVMKTIRKLCHHGNRDLVAFLSNLRLDYREEAALIERFFRDKPHTLVLLYLADLRERYTQKRGHFPNLFLVDSMVLSDPAFEIAHQPHVHTYWLKFLLLSTVAAQPDGIMHVNSLRHLFVELGGFDEALYRLTLGSLCTTRESRCLEPEPGERSTPAKVAVTSRGRALVSRWEDSNSLFCFSFTYLQLIADDFLMSYPTSIWREIYVPDVDLGYLFEDADTYSIKNRRYLDAKMRCSLALVFLMKVSYEVERERRPALFNELDRLVPSALPRFHDIVSALFEQYRKIATPLRNAKQLIQELGDYWEDLQRDHKNVRSKLQCYFDSGLKVD